MRLRVLYLPACLFAITQLTLYVHRQGYVLTLSRRATRELHLLEKNTVLLRKSISNVSSENDRLENVVKSQYNKLKRLVEVSRKNIIRIKGVPEKKNEILEEKIVELADFIDVKISTNDVERVNRIGAKRRNGARAIVAQMSSFKVKQLLIREAAASFRNLEFTIQDDATNYIMPNSIKQKTSQTTTECHLVEAVSEPETVGKSDTIFGAWMRDPLSSSLDGEGTIWVMVHFYENDQIEEYPSMRHFVRRRPRVTYKLPYDRAGTGHAVYNGSVYFNKFNSSLLVKYRFSSKSVEAERNLPDAAFGNIAPYQWSGSTDIDLAVDEFGLWVIYATPDNALDIVISKLNTDTLEVVDTWNTNWRKQWSGNAFIACGVLYVLKKYDERKTAISYTYDTHTKTYKHVEIPFINNYEWNTMLAYNHKEKVLYAWDRGFLVNYNVTFRQTSSR